MSFPPSPSLTAMLCPALAAPGRICSISHGKLSIKSQSNCSLFLSFPLANGYSPSLPPSAGTEARQALDHSSKKVSRQRTPRFCISEVIPLNLIHGRAKASGTAYVHLLSVPDPLLKWNSILKCSQGEPTTTKKSFCCPSLCPGQDLDFWDHLLR